MASTAGMTTSVDGAARQELTLNSTGEIDNPYSWGAAGLLLDITNPLVGAQNLLLELTMTSQLPDAHFAFESQRMPRGKLLSTDTELRTQVLVMLQTLPLPQSELLPQNVKLLGA